QIQHRQRARAQRLDLGKWFLLGSVADAAAGTHPNRAGFLHHRQQSRREPPRHGFIDLAARNAVRNDDEVHLVPSWMFRSQVNNHSSIWFPVTLSTKSNQIRAMRRRNSASQHKRILSREHPSIGKTASISPPQQQSGADHGRTAAVSLPS